METGVIDALPETEPETESEGDLCYAEAQEELIPQKIERQGSSCRFFGEKSDTKSDMIALPIYGLKETLPYVGDVVMV